MRSARPALTQEQQQMVRRLRGEGMTWQKAARAVGCSFTSAWFIGEGRPARAAEGRTYRQLYEEAQRRGAQGRSSMSKADLEAALSRSKSAAREKP